MENAARQNFSRAQAPQVPIQQPRNPSRPSGSRGASPRIISDTIIGKGPLPVPLPVVKAAASRAKPRSAESSPAPHPENPGYPYAQYPRYYDYASRPAADPYPYPGGFAPPTSSKGSSETSKVTTEPTNYPQTNNSAANSVSKENSPNEPTPVKQSDSAPAREEAHVPTAFSHPTNVRGSYAPPYPPAPYDPYAQHYPPAPAGAATYPPPGEYSINHNVLLNSIKNRTIYEMIL